MLNEYEEMRKAYLEKIVQQNLDKTKESPKKRRGTFGVAFQLEENQPERNKAKSEAKLKENNQTNK